MGLHVVLLIYAAKRLRPPKTMCGLGCARVPVLFVARVGPWAWATLGFDLVLQQFVVLVTAWIDSLKR